MSDVYTGPCQMNCPLDCNVPDGVTIRWVPPTNKDWSDVVRCPNDQVDCHRTFLVIERD